MARLPVLTLKVRFVIASVLAVGVFLTCVLVAISTFSTLNHVSSESSTDQRMQRLVTDAYEQWTLDDDQSNMYAAVVALKDPAQNDLAETTWKQAVDGYAAAQSDVALLAEEDLDPTEKKMLARITSDLADYNSYSQQLRDFATKGNIPRAIQVMTVDNLKPSNDLPIAFTTWDKYASENTAADAKNTSSTVSHGTLIELILAITGGVAMIVVMLWLALGVLRPLGKLRHRMVEIAHGDGDLTARVDVQRGDEIGALASAFNDFVTRMQGLLVEFASNSSTLRHSVANLGAVSAQLGQGATQTTEQARAVADATQSINTHLATVAAGATQLHSSVDEISRSAAEAAKASEAAVGNAQIASETAASLQSASDEIKAILKLITEIAEQTNLLALNATIEAARAGDAGKGFAVVAEEVKQLAGHTAQATADITDKVQAMEDSTHAVISAIDATVESIAKINDYSGAIAAAVEEQSATTAELSRTIEETATNTGGIASNVENVAATAYQASEGVTQTQESANELDILAGRVDELVGGFKF
ncbi:MAG TPA: methyl-accepting chemotaxis protein [Jatrophihabitans sp.]|jgi:methyl-accepting chemotaxis protein